MENEGKWKRFFDGLPQWKQNALASLALVLVAAMMPVVFLLLVHPAFLLLILSAVIVMCRLLHFLFKQYIRQALLRGILTAIILSLVLGVSFIGAQRYIRNKAGVCCSDCSSIRETLSESIRKRFPEYDFSSGERRLLIWSSRHVTQLWMETSEPDKCREIADYLRSVKTEHGIRKKTVLTIVDWNQSKTCNDIFNCLYPVWMPGREMRAIPPVFEETIE